MTAPQRRTRLLLDFEGPFGTLERVGWSVVDEGEEVASGTMPAKALNLDDASVEQTWAILEQLVDELDRTTPQQLTLRV